MSVKLELRVNVVACCPWVEEIVGPEILAGEPGNINAVLNYHLGPKQQKEELLDLFFPNYDQS